MTHLLAFALLAVVISFLYANTYRVPFFFDDMPNIVMNPYVPIEDLSWKSLKQVASESTNGRRWLPNISFSLNHYVDGFDVRGYHLVNIIIHIAAAFTLYLLGHLTLTLPSFSGGSRHAAEIAFAAALIWAVHPLQTNAVNYIIQRMTSMAALFYLLGLYCYVKARLQQPGAAKLIFFSLTIVLAFMAIVSKENSGMFPVVIIAYEILLLRRPDTGLFNQKKIALLLAGCFFLFIFICWHFLGSNPFASILGSYEHRAFSLGERLLSQARIVIHYLSLLVLPVPGRLNLMYEYQVSTGLLAPPQTLMAITLLAGLIFLVVRLYRHDRLFSFGICWLLVNLVVESSFIPLELVYEHRMYLPSMCLCLATVAWFYKLSASRPFRARIALFLVVSLLFAATWQRNTVWGNGIRFWSDVTAKSPNSMRGWINLGNAYSDAGNYTIAEQYLLKALALEKNDKSGNFSPESLKMTTANIHDALALIYRERKQYQRAIEHATLAMTLDPTRPNPLITLGIVYANLGEHQEAYKYFQQAWTKGLRNIDLFNNWAVSAFNLGRVDEAINMLHKALQIDPDHPESHYNLGVAYSSKGMLEEAQREMLRPMQLKQKK
jgi:tetratricopeptide (TPR) repeat protein